MQEPPATPEEDPGTSSESFYLYGDLRLDDPTTMQRMSPDELRCRVYETILLEQRRGRRGPKPPPWTVTYQRLQQMRRARNAIRSTGGEVTKQAIAEWIGVMDEWSQKVDTKTLDRWLKAAAMSWSGFFDEGINAIGSRNPLVDKG